MSRRTTIRIRRWEIDILAAGDATGGRCALVEQRVPAGAVTMPRHAFSREVVTYHVLAGTPTVVLDDRVVRLSPGETLAVPPGAFHALLVREGDGAGAHRDEPARVLAVLAPAGLEGFFPEAAASIPPTGTPDVPSVLEATARYGMTVDMPSLYDLTERFGVHLV